MPYRKLLRVVLSIVIVSILPSASLDAQDLEQSRPQAAGPAQREASPINGVPSVSKGKITRGGASFQNEFLKVEVASVAVARTKNRVSFALVFQNLSSKDIFLAVDRSYFHCTARVTDNLGAVVPTKSHGQEVFITGLPCLYGDGAKGQPQEYAKFSPGSKTSVLIAFENEHELFEGDTFSVGAELLRFDGGDFSKFSMGISDIEAQN